MGQTNILLPYQFVMNLIKFSENPRVPYNTLSKMLLWDTLRNCTLKKSPSPNSIHSRIPKEYKCEIVDLARNKLAFKAGPVPGNVIVGCS